MSTRTVRVSNDTWANSTHPQVEHGEDEDLRLKTATQRAFLWWRQPWSRDDVVSVASQTLRLTVKGASSGARTLSVRATSTRWDAAALNWDNQPAVSGATAPKAVDVLADGDVVEIDVTAYAKTVAAGAKNTGVRLTTDATATHRFYSADSPYPPEVVTVWTEQPDAPTLAPPSGIVSTAKPVIGFDYDEEDGDLTAVRVQVDAVGDDTADFDSGSVASTEAELDLSATAFTGLPAGTVRYIRGTITVGGVESVWSDWTPITYQPPVTLTVDSPAAGVVTSPTPTLLAHMAPGFTGETMTQYRVQVYDATRTTKLFDSMRQPATDPSLITVAVPHKWRGRRVLRKKGQTYSARFIAWGDDERAGTPGAGARADAWVDFEVTDTSIAAPTGLTVEPLSPEPGLLVSFTITPDAPDEIVIAADDEMVAVLDPADAIVSGSSYSWTYVGAKPYSPVEIKVAAVVDGDMSPWSASATGTTKPEGVWILDGGLQVVLSGLGFEDWTHTDQGIEYDPEGSPFKVWVETSKQGMTGTFIGGLQDAYGMTREAMLDNLWAIKRRGRSVQLVCEDFTVPVRLRDVTARPYSGFRDQRRITVAGFRFDQTDDLPWED